MSRKGNSMDNGLMENFFGILKTEMFYDQEDNYKTIDDLITNPPLPLPGPPTPVLLHLFLLCQ